MQKYTDVVLSTSGTPIGGATITVTNYPDGTPATIYASDGGTAVSSVTSDPTGRFAFYAADGHYSITIGGTGLISQTIDDVTLNDPSGEATTAALAGNGGAGLVGWLRAATGAVKRWVSDKLSDRVSVRDFTGDTVDGATSNQTGIAAAVAYCYANGKELHWPAGTYVSTASIPNFHDVVHSGNGVIKRGSTLFYITPVLDSQVNTLEVATTGNDANDGLSTGEPMLTAQRLLNVMQGVSILPKLKQGTWKAHIAAGTYAAANWSKGAIAGNYVEFYGDVDGSNVPTTIFDGTSSSANGGLYFDSGPSRLKLSNMKGQNFRGTSVASGFVVANRGIAVAYTKNLHSYNNQWAGVNADSIGQLLLEGGTHDNNTNYNLRVRGGVEISIGYNGSAGSNRVTLKNCATAAQVRDCSSGHFDWVDIINCPTGVWTTNCSRTTHTGLSFNTCNLAFRVDCSSTFNYDATTTFTGVTQRFTLSNSANDNGDGTGDGLCYDYANNYWTTGKSKWGGSSIFSTTAHAWCTDKTGTASFTYMVPDATDAQMIWGNKTNNAAMYMTVKMASYQYRFICNGTNALFVDSSSINAGRDILSTCGSSAARWLNVYSQNVVLSPPASVTPSNNGDMTFQKTSDTQLTIKVKGSDGVVRSASLTLA